MPPHDAELTWIRYIQDALRSPSMDLFFMGWHYVDSELATLTVIILVWYLLNRPLGIRLFYIFLLSGTLNSALKKAFALPRPSHLDPSLEVAHLSSFGLPSGAAQTAILVAGIIFIESENRVYRCLGLVFAGFLCFSRIYLGVHFFTDVLAGLAIGAMLLLIYRKVFPIVAKHWKGAIFLYPVLLLLIGGFSNFNPAAASLGVGLGLLMYEYSDLSWNPNLKVRLLQTAIVMAGALTLLLATATPQPVLALFFAILLGFWLSYLGCKIYQPKHYHSVG